MKQKKSQSAAKDSGQDVRAIKASRKVVAEAEIDARITAIREAIAVDGNKFKSMPRSTVPIGAIDMAAEEYSNALLDAEFDRKILGTRKHQNPQELAFARSQYLKDLCGTSVMLVAAMLSDAEANYKLGMSLLNVSSIVGAFPLLLEAANLGHADAQAELANFYTVGYDHLRHLREKGYLQELPSAMQDDLSVASVPGWRIEKDETEAAKWMRAAADQGKAAHQVGMGLMFMDGAGVPVDFQEAARWFSLAANQTDPAGCYHLGLQCLYGQGVPLDTAKAVRLLYQAAQKRDSDSIIALAVCFAKGKGVAQNYEEATRLLRFAALLEDQNVYFLLGAHFALGIGIEADQGEAQKWLDLARDSGALEEHKIMMEYFSSFNETPEQQCMAPGIDVCSYAIEMSNLLVGQSCGVYLAGSVHL